MGGSFSLYFRFPFQQHLGKSCFWQEISHRIAQTIFSLFLCLRRCKCLQLGDLLCASSTPGYIVEKNMARLCFRSSARFLRASAYSFLASRNSQVMLQSVQSQGTPFFYKKNWSWRFRLNYNTDKSQEFEPFQIRYEVEPFHFSLPVMASALSKKVFGRTEREGRIERN